jgi:hypothetical protein
VSAQLDLFEYAAGFEECPECGHRRASHYLSRFVHEDRRTCRVFTCYCRTLARPEENHP